MPPQRRPLSDVFGDLTPAAPQRQGLDDIFADVAPAPAPGIWDRIKNSGPRDWLATAVRLGGGYLAGIPAAVPGAGTAIGAGIGGGSEYLAQLIQKVPAHELALSLFDPGRLGRVTGYADGGIDLPAVGVAGAAGAIPMGKFLGTGAGALKNAGWLDRAVTLGSQTGLQATKGAALNTGLEVAYRGGHGELPGRDYGLRDLTFPAIVGAGGGALAGYLGARGARVAGGRDVLPTTAPATASDWSTPGTTGAAPVDEFATRRAAYRRERGYDQPGRPSTSDRLEVRGPVNPIRTDPTGPAGRRYVLGEEPYNEPLRGSDPSLYDVPFGPRVEPELGAGGRYSDIGRRDLTPEQLRDALEGPIDRPTLGLPSSASQGYAYSQEALNPRPDPRFGQDRYASGRIPPDPAARRWSEFMGGGRARGAAAPGIPMFDDLADDLDPFLPPGGGDVPPPPPAAPAGPGPRPVPPPSFRPGGSSVGQIDLGAGTGAADDLDDLLDEMRTRSIERMFRPPRPTGLPDRPPGWTRPPEDDLDTLTRGLGVSDDLEVRDPYGAGVNASGESGASLEAINRQRAMQGQGETFVVYDRAGQRRVLVGPDAVDYTVRPGETYGIEGPQGFRTLDDAGGRPPRADTGWPSAEEIRAQRAALEQGRTPEETLGEFFGGRARSAPAAAPEPMMPPPAAAPRSQTQPMPLEPGGTVPSMTSGELLRRLQFGEQMGPAAPAAADLPPDWAREVNRIKMELDEFPFQRGQSLDDPNAAFAPEGWTDSSASRTMYESQAANPNLIKHTPGAPVYHDIMGGRSGSRQTVGNALEQWLAGGGVEPPRSVQSGSRRRLASLKDWIVDRVLNVAQRRTLRDPTLQPAKFPENIEDIGTSRAALPERAEPAWARETPAEAPRPPEQLDEAARIAQRTAQRMARDPWAKPPADPVLGGEQPRLPGEVGAVRELEVAQPQFQQPRADPNDFDLTAEGGAAQQPRLSTVDEINAIDLPPEPPGAANVHPKIRELWDKLVPQWRADVAKQTAEGAGAPIVDRYEDLDKFAQRILDEPNPRKLWWKERQVRKIIDEGGFATADALFPIAGGLTGSIAGPLLDKEGADPAVSGVGGGIIGALMGLGLRNPRLLERMRSSGLYSGLAIPKSFLGNAGALASYAAEHPGTAGSVARETFSPETGAALRRGWRRGIQREGREAMQEDPSGAFSYAGRAIGAPDYATRDILERVQSRTGTGVGPQRMLPGISSEDAHITAGQYTLSGDPTSLPGEKAIEMTKNPWVRFVAPVVRTPVNWLERGLERFPGIGGTLSVRNWSGSSDALARRRQRLGGAALVAGAGLGIAAENTDLEPYLPLLTAAAGPYGMPLTMGAIGGPGLYGSTPKDKGPMGALWDMAMGVEKNLPLPSGFETPGRVASQYLPYSGAMRLLGPTAPDEFDTTGSHFAPMLSVIPGLNEALLRRKRLPAPRVSLTPRDR